MVGVVVVVVVVPVVDPGGGSVAVVDGTARSSRGSSCGRNASRRAAGPPAEEALKAGLKNPDAEVVARCRDLLDKIPYGITPDMPKRFVELIATARAGGPGAWPAVAPDLLDLGPRGLDVAQKLIDR